MYKFFVSFLFLTLPQAYALAESEKTSEAITSLTQLAVHGDADAAYNLGTRYQFGVDCKKDMTLAFGFYKLGADHGNISATYSLATMYQFGYGVDKNASKALDLLKKALNQGYLGAVYNIAVIYESGASGKIDHLVAHALLKYSQMKPSSNLAAAELLASIKLPAADEGRSSAFVAALQSGNPGKVLDAYLENNLKLDAPSVRQNNEQTVANGSQKIAIPASVKKRRRLK
jgi:TPR repeat protein